MKEKIILCLKTIITKSNGNKNYIYRVGSFYPKFMTSEKKQNSDDNDIPKEYTDKLKFNIFDYYCFRIFSRKKKDIELYKLGLSAYTKRMDIINVFTLLMLSEKNCLQSEDLYWIEIYFYIEIFKY